MQLACLLLLACSVKLQDTHIQVQLVSCCLLLATVATSGLSVASCLQLVCLLLAACN
jgi:O-antigen ligase